ncbi:MAG: hypothetical protein A2V67_03355 [Deltaproteobacteria bacterium RBG_13_61_14]|nr:MAG: hypothetical protein A2V67_03355 [Deltaproteobacteria bacterium RBG_13_61_14]
MKKVCVWVLGFLLALAVSSCTKEEPAPTAPEAQIPAVEAPAATAPAPAPAPAPAAVGGNVYEECKSLSIQVNTKTSQGNMPESSLNQAAETTCAICQQDPGGDACKAVMDQLKTQQ